jgi:hypothetical protein
VQKSLARSSIQIAANEGVQLCTGNEVVREVVRVLDKFSATRQLDKGKMYAKLRTFIEEHRAHIFDKDFLLEVEGVKKHDMHVASASQFTQTPVLTTDIELYCSLASKCPPAITPFEMWCNFKSDPFVFGVPFAPNRGSIFSRFSSEQISSGDRSDFKATVFDIEGFGWHYFDNKSETFKLELDLGQTISSNRIEKRPESHLSSTSWNNGEIWIDARCCDKADKTTHSHPLFHKIANLQLGRSRKAENYLNGCLRCVVFDDRQIGNAYWKKEL